jgi:hypothetical protein
MTPDDRARTIAYLDLAEGRGSVPLLDDAGYAISSNGVGGSP